MNKYEGISAGDLERLKAAELDILKEDDRICTRHGLKYTLAFGTMIGCVRHKGFIPWDDDIDVIMPVRDYEKFTKIARNELGAEYFLQNCHTDKGYRYPYMKIRRNNSCVVNTLSKKYAYYHKGIYMDIFPVHYLPRHKGVQMFQKYILTLNGHLITTFCFDIVKMARTFPQKVCKFILWIVSKILPCRLLLWIHDRITGIGTDENSDRLCIYCSEEMGFMEKYVLDKRYFTDRIRMPFEDGSFYMPEDYDRVMKHIYGNYMEIPREKKTHKICHVSVSHSYQERFR